MRINGVTIPERIAYDLRENRGRTGLVAVHSIGDIDIVEYDATYWNGLEHAFVPYYYNGEPTHRVYGSLHKAILGALAFQYDGRNTRADEMMARMLGIQETE